MNEDLKFFLLVVAGVLAAIALIGIGDEFDIPGLKQLHEAVGG